MTKSKTLVAATVSTLALCAALSLAAPAFAQRAAPQAAPSFAQQGPKKSVAVVDFATTGGFESAYGGVQAGGGLAALLETELSQGGRFRLAQRSHLNSVLYEQQLTQSGLSQAKGSAQAGQLTSAQYVVRGAVTDFTLNQSGGGATLTGPIGGVFGGISPQMQDGRLTLTFQVIDSTSGEVVDGFSITRKIKSRSIALTGTYAGRTLSTGGFKNTPLGEAARDAMVEAAARIGSTLSNRSWSAQVAQVRGGQLYVNAGAEGGLKVGDVLRIERVVDKIVDPSTGALLGVDKAEIGEAVVSSVQAQFAVATFQTAGTPQIGDVITLAAR